MTLRTVIRHVLLALVSCILLLHAQAQLDLGRPPVVLFEPEILQKHMFGVSLSKHGNLLCVGAFGEATKGPQAGAAFIYKLDESTGQWTYEATLFAQDGDSKDRLGLSVGLYENTAVSQGSACT